MAIETGTATDYHDAMDKLRIFLLAQNWTVLRWVSGSAMTDFAELIVRPVGNGSFRPIVAFRSSHDVPAGLYNWQLIMAQDFDTAEPFLSQPNRSLRSYVPLSNNTLTYWFYVNDRRVICVFKVATSYSSLYAGLFLPYALPSEYRRPLFVCGNSPSRVAINDNNNVTSFIAEPGQGNAAFMDMSDNWINVINRISSSVTAEPNLVANTTSGFLWPKKTDRSSSASQISNTSAWAYHQNIILRPNLAGEMPLFQCQLFSAPENNGNGAIMGAIDGVYDTPGFGRSPEQVVTFGGSDFRLFPNMGRTNLSNYMAIEEV